MLTANNNSFLPDTVLYSNTFDLKDYEFSFKTADYLNRWANLNIPNQYYYDSGNDFIARLPINGGKFNLLNGSVGFSGAKLEGSAGFEIAPGFLEAGFNVQAGYNLGEFNFDIPLSASVNAGILNNQLTIDIDANLNLPQFNYTFPFAYAYLDALFGYDLRVDAFAEASAKIGSRYLSYNNEIERYLKIIDVQGESKKRLVQLDTRRDDNFIDLIYKKIQLGDDKNDSVSRTETSGYVALDFDLPRFNGDFNPIAGLEDEYIWEFKEERELIKADFALDNLLAQIPILKWLSIADSIDFFSLEGYNIGLEYDWRAIALDLSASLNIGYNFKTGITDLFPQIVTEKSELDSWELSFDNKEQLLNSLEAADTDGERDIDIVVEFNPKIIFEADAYLKPEVNFDWDIGVIGGQLSPLTSREEFTLFPGNTINLFSEKIPIVPLTRREVPFKDLYHWITGTEPDFTDITLEIPFTDIEPGRYGTDHADFTSGTSGNDTKKLGKGDDSWVLSEGNDDVDGEEGLDTLWVTRSQNYTLTANSITDSVGNQTTFDNFESLFVRGRFNATSAINIEGDLSNIATPILSGVTTDFNDTIQNSKIVDLNTRKGDDIVRGTLYELNGSGPRIITGEGHDEITVSKITTQQNKTQIKAGPGDDHVNLTIIPTYSDSEPKSFFEVDLDTGNDTIVAKTGSPTNSGTSLRPAELLVTGQIGGKTIDIDLEPSHYESEVILEVKTPVLKDLFTLEQNTELDRLFIDIADNNINYNLDNTNPEALQIQDKIIKADQFKIDLTDFKSSSLININPKNLAVSSLIIDGDDAFTEVVIDTHDLGNISNIPIVEINVKKVNINSINFDFLERKLRGNFRTLDLSERETGIFIGDNFLSYSGQSLDIFEVIFTDAEDTIYLSPNSNDITTVGLPELRGELMSFDLGEGDDRFHDRVGFRDSIIYPGSGNDFIYGAGGFDEVFYEQGSRLDYEITVIDDRTIEVYYQKDGTIDTLIDVEAINFEGADERVENPYYQGPDPNLGYITFTLPVDQEYRNWDQPPFIYSPWTHIVPFGTTEITLTKDFLLTNIYDAEGDEDKLEISYLDVSTSAGSSLNPDLDTTDPSVDVWQVTIPEGLNNDREAVVIEYEVEDSLGSLQGNFLYIYPSSELSYALENAAVNLTASAESESITATEFNDIINGVEGNDILEGNQGNDTLNGGDGNDSLDGGDGNDTLNGGTGNDIIIGHLGDGNDFYDGGEDTDLISYENTTLALSVNLETGVIQNNGTNEDTLLNIENFLGGQGNDIIIGSSQANRLNGLAGDDFLDGGEGQDLLEGREGNDTLNGSEGDDVLLGAAGADTLTGGDGRDQFVLAAGNGTDLITDFEDTQDLMVLDGITFDPLTIESADNATVVKLGEEVLVTLNGIESSLITVDDFVSLL